MIIISPIGLPVPKDYPVSFGYVHKQKSLYLRHKRPIIHQHNKRLTVIEKMNVLKDLIKRKWKLWD